MREIKFKVFADGKMYEPFKLNWLKNNSGRPDDFNSTNFSEGVIFLQWTGLKDKDQKEVYDGDILEIDGHRIVKVEWKEVMGLWDLVFVSDKFDKKFLGCPMARVNSRGKVIGNIHQDPDLL